jgi:hypothetical protein
LSQNGDSVSGSQFPPPGILFSLFARPGPSNFWLFGYRKRVLQGSSFDEPDGFDELLLTVQKLLKEVDHETVDAVFQEWMA